VAVQSARTPRFAADVELRAEAIWFAGRVSGMCELFAFYFWKQIGTFCPWPMVAKCHRLCVGYIYVYLIRMLGMDKLASTGVVTTQDNFFSAWQVTVPLMI